MIKNFIVALFFLGISSTSLASQEYNQFFVSYITGNAYNQFNEGQKDVYSIGIVDGLMLSPLYGASIDKLRPISTCTSKMPSGQLKAVISKYLAENPARWHEDMHKLALDALNEVCKL